MSRQKNTSQSVADGKDMHLSVLLKFSSGKAQLKKLFEYAIFKEILILAVVLIAIAYYVGVGVGNGKIYLSGSSVTSGLPAQLNYSSVNQVYQDLRTQYNGKLT